MHAELAEGVREEEYEEEEVIRARPVNLVVRCAENKSGSSSSGGQCHYIQACTNNSKVACNRGHSLPTTNHEYNRRDVRAKRLGSGAKDNKFRILYVQQCCDEALQNNSDMVIWSCTVQQVYVHYVHYLNKHKFSHPLDAVSQAAHLGVAS